MKLFYFARIDLCAHDASQRHVLEFCRSFAKFGHEVTLFVPDLGARPRFEGIHTVYVPVFSRRSSVTFFTFYFSLLFLFLKKYFSGDRPDVVYTRYQQMEWLVTWLRFILKFIYVIEINGVTRFDLSLYGKPGWWIAFVCRMEKCVFQWAHLLVTPSGKIREILCEQYGLGQDRFLVVSNGADAETFRPMDQAACRVRLGLEGEAQYLIFVGSFKKWHGILEIIQIFPDLLAHSPKVRLLLLGKGTEYARAQKIIDELGLRSCIHLLGEKPLEEIPEYINASDLCLAPYFDREIKGTAFSPIKIFEYMACGKPVLGSPLGGFAEIFEKFPIGLMIDSADARDWTPVILSLLNSPEKMRELGENGRRAVLAEFNWDAIAGKIAARLETLRAVP